MAKIQRADLTLMYKLADLVDSDEYYIDLAQCLSILNRRNYHQRMYHVSKIDIWGESNLGASGKAARIAVTTVPNTWVVANAWVRAKAAWKKSRAQVLEDTPDIEGKWDSFKVYMNAAHAQAGVGANLIPLGATSGEWDMSSLIMPADATTDVFNMHVLGEDQSLGTDLKSAGMVQGYSEVRPVVSLKETQADIGDSWLTRLFDLGGQESELAEHIVDEGDEPPYARDDYPGTGTNSIAEFAGFGTINSFSPQHSIPGFYVPSGILQLAAYGDFADDGLKMFMSVHVTPGSYKGVHAIPMRQ